MTCQYAAPKPDKCPKCLSTSQLFRDDWQGRWCCDGCGWYDGIEADQLRKAMYDDQGRPITVGAAIVQACTDQHRTGLR